VPITENGYPCKRIAQNGSCARAPCVAQTAFQGVKLGALITWLLVCGLGLVIPSNDAARVHLEPRAGAQTAFKLTKTDPALTLGSLLEVGSKILR